MVFKRIAYNLGLLAGLLLLTFLPDARMPGGQGKANQRLGLSHQSGFYRTAIQLRLFSDTGDSIYYTLNGNDPGPFSKGSKLYSEAILLSSSSGAADLSMIPGNAGSAAPSWKPPVGPVFKASVLKARSYSGGKASSEVLTTTYFISEDMHERYSMPLLSLTSPATHLFSDSTGIAVPGKLFDPSSEGEFTGNYMQRGREWERPAHLEFFNPDGSLEFAQNVGVRIHGGNSRQSPQKSFRVYARSEYGNPTLDYPLFPGLPVSSFKRFILQTTDMVYKKGMFIDDMAQHLSEDLTDGMASRPCILFINGEYWGIYKIRERIDQHYLHTHFSVDPDEVDLLESSWQIEKEGTKQDYIRLLDYLKSNDVREDSVYGKLCRWMDMDNFIDYQAVEIFFGNRDWPMGNILYWRPEEEDARWRWLLVDLDAAFTIPARNMFLHATTAGGSTWPNPDQATFLFRTLLKNKTFEAAFFKRFLFLVDEYFNSEILIGVIDSFQSIYAPELDEHFRRWPTSSNNKDAWLDRIDECREFAYRRPAVVNAQVLTLRDLDTLRISGNSFDSGVILFPNPARDFIFLEFKEANQEYRELEIYDMAGVLTHKQELVPGKLAYKLDLSRLPAAMYQCSLRSGDGRLTLPFLRMQ